MQQNKKLKFVNQLITHNNPFQVANKFSQNYFNSTRVTDRTSSSSYFTLGTLELSDFIRFNPDN